MKKSVFVLLMLVVLVVASAVVFNVSAADSIPEGVQVFELSEYGLVCALWPDGSGDCYCPCKEKLCQPTIIPTDTDTPQDRPTSTPVHPTSTPIQVPTTNPTEKPKCNRGIGNGGEDCDPGNSSGQGEGGGRRAGEDRDE